MLVGAIEGVAKDTRWDPAPLTEALLKADRVMFPDTLSVTASPFAMVGYLMRWRKHATLPKGQTLAQMMRPEQFARLTALKKRGVLKSGFERKHPFHLALSLRKAANGARGYGAGASEFVTRTARKHKLKLVPIAQAKAKPLAEELFTARPESHIPCLMDAVTMAEAGPAAVKARSDAWAQRRVPNVINSPAEKVYQSCWPAGSKHDIDPSSGLLPTMRRLLATSGVTVAVVSLDSLAQNGGILDDLKAAGYDVRGPRWR